MSDSDEISAVRTFLYDARHNMLEATDNVGLTQHFTYNAFDLVTSATNSLAAQTVGSESRTRAGARASISPALACASN